jgi:lipoate-protein ligase A
MFQLVRRPTGGGIVKHGNDWTYGLILPKGHASSSIPALELYESIHQAMARALNEQGLSATLKPCPQSRQKGIPGDCFLEPVARDLMSEDGSAKIAGAAMKRTRAGIDDEACPLGKINP